jgi:hypothetical protein
VITVYFRAPNAFPGEHPIDTLPVLMTPEAEQALRERAALIDLAFGKLAPNTQTPSAR